jgi:fucose 4-O-acetylase-like acetyltransferase
VSATNTRSTNVPPESAAVVRSVRIDWVDAAKGFGIILVVLGHVIRGLVNSHVWMWTPTSFFIDGWIYAFHMPLFFFLSGLFLVRSTEKRWLIFVTEKLRTLAYPYFVWSVITLLIKTPLSGITNRPDGLSDFSLILYKPVEQYWFLYVLFALSLSIAGLLRLGVRPWAVLALSIIIYPGILPISEYGWVVLAMASTCAIYVALGVVVGWRKDLGTISSLPPGRLGFAVLAGLMVSSLGGVPGLPYRYAFEPFLAIAGTSAIVALAVLADTTKLGVGVRLLGRYSLEIYVAHTIASAAVRIALQKFAHVTALAPHLILGTLVGLYLPIAIAIIFDRIGFRYGFTLAPVRKAQVPLDPKLRSNRT